jgi:hypothetical protein
MASGADILLPPQALRNKTRTSRANKVFFNIGILLFFKTTAL